MFNIYREELDWGGRKLTLETGHIARQADGAVLITYGETVVLCTVVADKNVKEGMDFFPLAVFYQEKAFAAGKIPGGFFKREGRPSEKEVLRSRLIDRPLRPVFPEGFKNEVQIICTVLSHDLVNDPEIIAIVGASAALTISGIPFLGPVGGARVGYVDGEYVLNPMPEQMAASQLDLVVAGTRDGILMVESEIQELNEDVIVGAIEFAHQSYTPVLDAIIRLAEKAAKDPWDLTITPTEEQPIYNMLKNKFEASITQTLSEPKKAVRQDQLKAIRTEALEALTQEIGAENFNKVAFGDSFKRLKSNIMRAMILDQGRRIDGRDLKTVRPIMSEIDVLPKTHGSALFTRGETQALVVTTLGTGEDEQIMDDLTGEYRERFMLHYNFPPYSVGEVGRMMSPGRREIGHGKLAWRAIRPLLPSKENFPYTIRVVSEITECNGSSSMATVCGTSLALMDAGVPLPSPVAGIAMGLIKDGKRYAVLSDILGDEDDLGDMDFKVAGTNKGVTALQMDIKMVSMNIDIIRVAIEQAKEGRLHILKEMNKAITSSRDSVNENAPRITTFMIPKDKIREVIGTGGKVIREICESTGAKLDIEDDGTIRIAGASEEIVNAAVKRVRNITDEPEIGVTYEGKVVKIMEFGAFINFMGAKDGLLHISELSRDRSAMVEQYLSEGDVISVRVSGIDDRGKIKLVLLEPLEATKEVQPRTEGDVQFDNEGRGDKRPRDRDRDRNRSGDKRRR